LADRVDVDAGRGLLREAAFEQRGDAADVLNDLETALHLALRVGEDLAVLLREDRGDVVPALVDKLAYREQELLALGERYAAPARERLFGRLHGAIDLLDRGEVHLLRLHPKRGVVDRAAAARLAGDNLPADPVAHAPELARALLLLLQYLRHRSPPSRCGAD
jgi:hypothetical protein